MRPTASSYSRALRSRITPPPRRMAPFTWYGGKGILARKLLGLLPEGPIYVEPYCGAASLFWHLDPPRPTEVLNDLNGEIINLFRILQSRRHFNALAHRLTWTPYSRAEFVRALQQPPRSPVDRAWAFFVSQSQGFGGKAGTPGNWGRSFSGKSQWGAWRSRLHCLDHFHDRLTRVQLDHRDALVVIRYWDTPETVFYLDPPYPFATRVDRKAAYRHECTDQHHRDLVETLLTLQGRAMLSGYDTELYTPLLDAGWQRHRFHTVCFAAGKGRNSPLRGRGNTKKHASRTECIWLSPERPT